MASLVQLHLFDGLLIFSIRQACYVAAILFLYFANAAIKDSLWTRTDTDYSIFTKAGTEIQLQHLLQLASSSADPFSNPVKFKVYFSNPVC